MITEDTAIEDFQMEFRKEINNFEEASRFFLSGTDLKILKAEFPDKWNYLSKKLVYPYEHFKNLDDYQKPANKLKKDVFSKLNKKRLS